MWLLAGCFLIPLCSALEPSVFPIFGHELSSSVHPCDNFHESICNVDENNGSSAFLKGMHQLFSEKLRVAFLKEKDPILDALLPIMLEKEKEKNFKEFVRKNAREALKHNTFPKVRYEPQNERFQLKHKLFIDLAEHQSTLFNLSTGPHFFKGFVNGFFGNNTHEIKTVYTVDNRNIRLDGPLEDHKKIGLEWGSDVAKGVKSIPRVLVIGDSMELDFTPLPEEKSYEECHPYIQGVVDEYIDQHKEKNITTGEQLSVIYLNESMAFEKIVKDIPVDQTDALALFEKQQLWRVENYFDVVKYLVAMENNMMSEKTKTDVLRIYNEIKEELLSIVQNAHSLTSDVKNKIGNYLNNKMDIDIGYRWNRTASELRKAVDAIRAEFFKLKSSTAVPENCNLDCLLRHYGDLIYTTYKAHFGWSVFSVEGTWVRLEERDPSSDRHSTIYTNPQYFYLPDDSAPLSLKYGLFGQDFAGALLGTVDSLIKSGRETEAMKCFTDDFVNWVEYKTEKEKEKVRLELRLRAKQIALRAMMKDEKRNATDLKLFFIGSSINNCHVNYEMADKMIQSLPEFRMIFQCQPRQKMFERMPQRCRF
ncbi:hypothetical protein QR680_014165 [Steinernema hermaphroditum]|uniref:Peptidase M13 C-terminal domain-containing protein n=1 Tax=Steinernema hermaphroditum TaxID=289476 RepID=A0AA39I7W7_9BILA|nr:hypothetical protein QR680_014165 [Steinernema hermaphroditum]